MSVFGYVIFGMIVLLGIAAIRKRDNVALRRWVIRVYACLIGFLALTVYLVGPRLAEPAFETVGAKWSQEAARGADAMHSVYLVLDSFLFVMALVLLVLASKPPQK